MYTIYKITSNPVVDFAAEELKKYLRMMMPRCGEITISYKPDATDGYRLGLMQDFGLDVGEAEDTQLDDLLHIDTDAEGGIIAGDNPRSVLLAVYRYLTINGCRWLFPGVDGEFIPVKNVEPVQYHKLADSRYRGQCNEGAESQQALLDTIDFSPKIGLNTYMIEFDIPKIYYDWYYTHKNNTANREAEPVSEETVLQWKRMCEVEIAKRGLQFHDMGHGWTAESFGISSIGGWTKNEANPVPEESRPYLAMINGKRELFNGIALNTNFCMSNADARQLVAKSVADYAQLNNHVTYLHVWLADGQMNHCECDVCVTKTPSDWYVVLLNDIDAELTRRGLNTRIGVIVYSDTAYEPTCETIRNPQRFVLLMGAVTRSYTYSVEAGAKPAQLTQFVLNKSGRLETIEEHIYRANLWTKYASSPLIAYEYHFWKPQFYAPGVLSFAKRLYEDVHSYHANGFCGMIEDGSQRSYFPNGLSYYVYASALFDLSLAFEEIVEDYLRHAYGEAWETVYAYLKIVDELLPQTYLEARHTIRGNTSQFYVPRMQSQFMSFQEKTQPLIDKLAEYRNSPMRVQTVAIRLLLLHNRYCRGLAEALAMKCVGKDLEAKTFIWEFMSEFGQCEAAVERYYDQMLTVYALQGIFNTKCEFAQ